MLSKYLFAFLCLFASLASDGIYAQELNCKVTVNAQQITGVDPKIFETLQSTLNTFCNTRKWSNDNFEPTEKITLNFNLIIEKKVNGVDNAYECKLNIQSSRPVYNSDYNSPLINFADKDVVIKYEQFQPIDFNENRISGGSDPLVSNLSAIFAYYIYIALGLDYDSFSEKGGTEFYKKAQNIVINAPEGSGINGWRGSEGNRNRFWLSDNLLNNRFSTLRDQLYQYHRKGLDNMTKDPTKSMETILGSVKVIHDIYLENPQSHLIQFYFNAKGDEYLNIIKNATDEQRKEYIPMVAQMDVLNAQKYNALLK